MSGQAAGTLTLVATPIGNLGDISGRAREALAGADLIACEDTRATGRLLKLLELPAPRLIASHEHNEQELAAAIADRVAAGGRVALVSDAGTPAISDPGFRAVRECRRRGLPVTAVPGPCAAITALSVSGLPSDGFLFAGFLPPKSAARRRFLERYSEFEYTVVLYESCHRIGKLLDDIVDTLGAGRCICVTRELTKLHETVTSGPAAEVRDAVAARSRRGEFVVLVAKAVYAL